MVVETERKYGMKIRLEHIRTELNKVPDLLSRGDVTEAIEMVRRRFGYCEVRSFPMGLVEALEEQMLRAI
jgi:hypothetical protein